MKKFEYKIEKYHKMEHDGSGILPMLNNWGEKGWELMSVIHAENAFDFFIFKKEVI